MVIDVAQGDSADAQDDHHRVLVMKVNVTETEANKKTVVTTITNVEDVAGDEDAQDVTTALENQETKGMHQRVEHLKGKINHRVMPNLPQLKLEEIEFKL